MKNTVWEQFASFLLDLRCSDLNRDGYIRLDSCREEKAKLEAAQKEYMVLATAFTTEQRIFLENYFGMLESVSFEEQQEAYCQGIVDSIQVLSGLGMLQSDGKIERAIQRMKKTVHP